MSLSLIRESDRLRLRQPPYPRIEELAAQIKEHGQTTPMFVRPLHGLYELISGYRRRAALEKLGISTALVRVFDVDEAEAYSLAISENQDRDALTDMERADICARLQRDGLTAAQIATKMGWSSERQVHRYLRVAKQAPESLRAALQAEKLSMALAGAFLDHAGAIPCERHDEVLAHAAEHEMTVAEFGRYLKRALEGPKEKSSAEPLRVLKGGGFTLAALRCDGTDVERIDAQIELLREAMRRARALRRKAEHGAVASEAEAE